MKKVNKDGAQANERSMQQGQTSAKTNTLCKANVLLTRVLKHASLFLPQAIKDGASMLLFHGVVMLWWQNIHICNRKIFFMGWKKRGTFLFGYLSLFLWFFLWRDSEQRDLYCVLKVRVGLFCVNSNMLREYENRRTYQSSCNMSVKIFCLINVKI